MALKGVDIDVNDGEIVTLIGANGAGKSTLMMTIFGNPRAREGSISSTAATSRSMPTHEIARLRIAQAPEGRRIFPRMTVLENLQMGATVADPAHFDEDLERVFALFPRLKRRIAPARRHALRRRAADAGDRARADEPPAPAAAGRAVARPGAADGAADFRAIRELNTRERLTVFLVEQNAFHALKLAHRGYVMVNGQITLSGSGRNCWSGPRCAPPISKAAGSKRPATRQAAPGPLGFSGCKWGNP